MDPENPYEPPNSPPRPTPAVDLSLPPLPKHRWPEVDVHIANVQHGWITRRITLAGSLNCELYYNAAAAGEQLFVNNALLLTTSGLSWRIAGPN